jgi:hypothetical protein
MTNGDVVSRVVGPDPTRTSTTMGDERAIAPRDSLTHGDDTTFNPLAAAFPAALFPVRLETRFTRIAGKPYLLVRIYPDQIGIDTHEPKLTDHEWNAGCSYWEMIWRAGTGLNADEKGPWRMLATQFGSPRAAWIASQTEPENPESRPTQPVPAPVTLLPKPMPRARAGSRSSSWARPPLAVGLPDRWTVVLYNSGSMAHQVECAPIQHPLHFGPDPLVAGPADSQVLQIDPKMLWTIDFEEAEKVGMAVRIEITEGQAVGGFDRVIVAGLSADGPEAGAARIRDILNAHHFTDGLAFVPQGTPTNNTSGEPAGLTRRDLGYERSFSIECAGPLEQSDGLLAAAAIGIPSSTFAHVEFSGHEDQENARAMAIALWSATLGYFLRQMMNPVFTLGQIEDARAFFRDCVRARGPLPAIRIGDTPYGLLPTTSLETYTSPRGGTLQSGLCAFLLQMLGVWKPKGESSTHVGAGEGLTTLVELLASDASARSYFVRHVVGDELLESWGAFINVDQDRENVAFETQAGRDLLNAYGYSSWDPRAVYLALSRKTYEVPFQIVQEEPLSETIGLRSFGRADGSKGNYISWLRHATIDQIREDDSHYPGGKAPTALLYKVLRQSILLDTTRLAAEEGVLAGYLTVAETNEPEFIGVREDEVTVTAWTALESPIVAPDGSVQHIGTYLETTKGTDDSRFQSLVELHTALERLALLPSAELERLFTETMDACSHRLDAWMTSLATDRLAKTRANDTTRLGVHVGGFGWVENLRPKAANTPVVEMATLNATTPVTTSTSIGGPSTPVREAGAESGGFIHAPSLAQARVAAVLRGGFLTRSGEAKGELAIELSSERVRRALWTIDGVRQGQSLGALLGYRFETTIHEQYPVLAQYIPALRHRYPLVPDTLTASGLPASETSAPNVVNGLELQRKWKGDWEGWESFLKDSTDLDHIKEILTQLDSEVDALADLSISESVFQVLQGNYGRAGGLLDALARGDHPPDPEVVRTPRNGIDITHRLMVLFCGDPPRDASWPGGSRARAKAEPRLDRWLTSVLPNPKRIVCTVEGKVGGITDTTPVSLYDLGLCPLDALSLADAADLPQESELEQRIRYEALKALGTDATDVRIFFEPEGGRSPGELYFLDFLAVARAARDVIGVPSRPLEPKDLSEPQKAPVQQGASFDDVELADRADAALAALKSAWEDLDAEISDVSATAAAIRAKLLYAGQFGVGGSVPVTRRTDDAARATLKIQAVSVRDQVRKRHKAAAGFDQAFDRTKAVGSALRDHLTELMRKVFGGSFVLLPQFTPAEVSPVGPALKEVFDQSVTLLDGEHSTLLRWFQQLTHIQPGVARADLLDALRHLVGPSRPPERTVGQLPHKGPSAMAPDRWVGLARAAGQTLPEAGGISLVAELVGAYDGTSAHSGLLIDEWTERIPNSAQTSGVAFHFDRPNAVAPQVLLLAVCPDDRATWDIGLLNQVLYETLNNAKVRAVDYDTLCGFSSLPDDAAIPLTDVNPGRILPALYFAFNPDGQTVSAEFIMPN